MKPRPVGDEYLQACWRTDIQTDMTKLVVAFCNSVNAPTTKSNTFVMRIGNAHLKFLVAKKLL